jgi:hypothetical protein
MRRAVSTPRVRISLLGFVLIALLSGCVSTRGGANGGPPVGHVLADGEKISRCQNGSDDEEKPEYPDEGRDGLFADYPEAPPPFGISRIREWVQTDDPDGSEGGEAGISRMRPRSDPRLNIRAPDPDTANFPNSAYTIPQGRVYVESSPVTFYGPSPQSGRVYNWEFLLRYGLTDWLELRLFSNGYSSIYTKTKTTGFSPLAFDMKIHLWDENKDSWIPGAGLEVYIETQMGSRVFNQGTQPSLNILFDHSLPLGFQFEWNAGLTGNVDAKGAIFYELALAWALQHGVTDNFAVFTHGYLNNPSLPRFGQSAIRGLGDNIVVGAGAIWTPTDRFAIFGSFNFGVTTFAPDTIALLGGAPAGRGAHRVAKIVSGTFRSMARTSRMTQV